MGNVFGSAVSRELLDMRCGKGDVEVVSRAALEAMKMGEEEGRGG